MKSRRGLLVRVLWYLPRSWAHRVFYRHVMGKKLDLKNPRDLNEKIQYLMVYKYGEREGRLADKYLVKDYVTGLGITGLKVPQTYQVYDDAKKIDLAKLPEQFVLKCNHGSGGVFVCTNKDKFDMAEARRVLQKNLEEDYARRMLEYHYSTIKRMIIAEEYLEDGKHERPLDYKFYCYDGEVKSVMVCSERGRKVRFSDFDLDWRELDYARDEWRDNGQIERPKSLEKMIEVARMLSAGLPFVRVDLYEIHGEVYFGELTMTPAAGVDRSYKPEALEELGRGIDLNKAG